jgi:hypothetical protein
MKMNEKKGEMVNMFSIKIMQIITFPIGSIE